MVDVFIADAVLRALSAISTLDSVTVVAYLDARKVFHATVDEAVTAARRSPAIL